MIVTSSGRHSTSRRAIDSRYGRLWTTIACLAAAAWIGVAVTMRRFVVGMLSSAAAVLVLVGIGHHVIVGLHRGPALVDSSASGHAPGGV